MRHHKPAASISPPTLEEGFQISSIADLSGRSADAAAAASLRQLALARGDAPR
jgi:hypothetical protein